MTTSYKFIFFLLLFNAAITLPQDKANVKFIVHTSPLNSAESVFITGDDSLLGFWTPNSVELERVNDTTFARTFKFEHGESFEYKFTKGSWENEALNDDGTVPANSFLFVSHDTLITVRINKWGKPLQRKIMGGITGTVMYHKNFEAADLKPRDIIVWLPPSYVSLNTKRYPVLYMQDGQNIIDPSTSSFGYDWRVDEVTDSLIKIEKLNEIIVVGIYNTENRRDEYSHTLLGRSYMSFVVNKLKPFIDSTYRTLPDPKNTAVAGSSMGGLISFMLAWNYPEVFSKAACLSPAFKLQQFNYVDTVKNYNGRKKEITFYFDNGGIGLEHDLQPGVDEMAAALQNLGYELNKDLLVYIDPNAVHSESAWAQRIWRPLMFFFAK